MIRNLFYEMKSIDIDYCEFYKKLAFCQPKFLDIYFWKAWINFLIQSLNRHKENMCLVGVFHVMYFIFNSLYF